jgi:pilus assembly protein Flp/PilA
MATISRFWHNESGATAVEYGLILAVMSLAIIGSGSTVWTAIRDKFIFLGNTVKTG